MRISDWSSDVCSSDLTQQSFYAEYGRLAFRSPMVLGGTASKAGLSCQACHPNGFANEDFFIPGLSDAHGRIDVSRSEEHTSELQSLMRISYAVFCLKKKK